METTPSGVSSGFEITSRAPKKAEVPVAPTKLNMSSNGNVRMIGNKPAGATSLCWAVFIGDEVTPVNIVDDSSKGPLAANVLITPVGSTRLELKGLPPGTLITAQALAQNTAGKSGFSMPVSIYVNK